MATAACLMKYSPKWWVSPSPSRLVLYLHAIDITWCICSRASVPPILAMTTTIHQNTQNQSQFHISTNNFVSCAMFDLLTHPNDSWHDWLDETQWWLLQSSFFVNTNCVKQPNWVRLLPNKITSLEKWHIVLTKSIISATRYDCTVACHKTDLLHNGHVRLTVWWAPNLIERVLQLKIITLMW